MLAGVWRGRRNASARPRGHRDAVSHEGGGTRGVDRLCPTTIVRVQVATQRCQTARATGSGTRRGRRRRRVRARPPPTTQPGAKRASSPCSTTSVDDVVAAIGDPESLMAVAADPPVLCTISTSVRPRTPRGRVAGDRVSEVSILVLLECRVALRHRVDRGRPAWGRLPAQGVCLPVREFQAAPRRVASGGSAFDPEAPQLFSCVPTPGPARAARPAGEPHVLEATGERRGRTPVLTGALGCRRGRDREAHPQRPHQALPAPARRGEPPRARRAALSTRHRMAAP